MKSAGQHALDWANGKTWTEIIRDVRAETLDWYTGNDRPYKDRPEPQNEAAAPHVDPGYTDSGSGVWT